MKIEPFYAQHLDEIALQPAQEGWRRFGSRAYALALQGGGCAYTARSDRLVACAGIASTSATVGHLWGFFAVDSGRHFVRLHKMARRLLEVCGKTRVLANTEADFGAGCRWLELLGFTVLTLEPKFGPDGRDHVFYVRTS
jgi:hypothetical protein